MRDANVVPVHQNLVEGSSTGSQGVLRIVGNRCVGVFPKTSQTQQCGLTKSKRGSPPFFGLGHLEATVRCP